MKRTSLTLSILLILFAGGVWGEEWKDTRIKEKCGGGPDIWNEEKQICETAGAPFASEIYPKPIHKEEPSSSFVQSVILFLPEQEGDRENWGDTFKPPVRDGVECWPQGRVTFLVTLNADKKIIKIESDSKDPSNSRCYPKEDFNICIAKPFGWDLSLVENEEVCFW